MIEKIKKMFNGLVIPIGIAIMISTVFVNFVGRPTIIQGESMYPTLKNGDFGFSGVMRKNKEVKRNDIVSLKIDDEKIIIKRIIGLPNEKVKCDGTNIFIDDKLYNQDYLENDTWTDPFEIELSDDEYFVLGDNRGNSKDSREYGTFNKKDIITNGIFVITPENFGLKK